MIKSKIKSLLLLGCSLLLSSCGNNSNKVDYHSVIKDCIRDEWLTDEDYYDIFYIDFNYLGFDEKTKCHMYACDVYVRHGDSGIYTCRSCLFLCSSSNDGGVVKWFFL